MWKLVFIKRKKLCFQIETPGRMYHMMSDSESDMREWIDAINSLIGSNKLLSSNGSSGTSNTSFIDSQSGEKKVNIEDFEKLKVVGKGSFGKVLLVRKMDDKKIFAMKILDKATIVEKEEVEHTRSEKSILTKLDHPFLIKLHYSFQTPEKLYLIMDFVNGGELFFHLQQQQIFNEETAKFLCGEILLALEYLHSNGIVYRDLKPENLLISKEGHIIMTDFGLSKEGLNDPNDRTGTFCGTPEYLAPEILEGKTYGKGVDWWSFGSLLFEMLTGLPPFYDEDLQNMYTKIMTEEVVYPNTLPEHATDLLKKNYWKEILKSVL